MRTYVISVTFQNPDKGHFHDNEFLKLAKSLDVLSVKKNIVLRLSKSDPAFLISRGHLDDVKSVVSENDIGLILIDNPLTPVQQRNLEKKLVAKVLDRTGLVLEIF